MLVGFKAGSMIAVILIDGSYFQIAVLQDRDTGLNADDPVIGSKCTLAESEIEVEWANWKHVQNGFLRPCRYRYSQALTQHEEEAVGRIVGAFAI